MTVRETYETIRPNSIQKLPSGSFPTGTSRRQRLPTTHSPEPRWLFSHEAGVTPWRPDYMTLAFGRLRATLGLDSVRLHDLRAVTRHFGDGADGCRSPDLRRYARSPSILSAGQ